MLKISTFNSRSNIKTLLICYYVFTFIPRLAVAFRRAHDTGYGGWLVILILVISYLIAYVTITNWYEAEVSYRYYYSFIDDILPCYFPSLSIIYTIVGELPYLYFFTKDSQSRENKWGANPKEVDYNSACSKKIFNAILYYLISPFKKYFDFINGRASRTEYWFFAFINLVIWFLFCAVFSPSFKLTIDPVFFFHPQTHNLINYPFFIIFITLLRIPSLAVEFRRIHDIGYSGRYVFVRLLLSYPILASVYLYLFVGFPTKLDLLIILGYPLQLLKYPLQFTIVGGPVLLLLVATTGGIHELSYSNWGYGPFIFSFVLLLAYLYLFTKKSQPGKNKWGQNPDVVILTEYEIEKQKNSQSQQSLEK